MNNFLVRFKTIIILVFDSKRIFRIFLNWGSLSNYKKSFININKNILFKRCGNFYEPVDSNLSKV